MPNYIEVLGGCFPDARAYCAGDPTVYGDVVWETTPIAQATLDASDCAAGAVEEPITIQFYHHNALLSQTFSTVTTVMLNTPVHVSEGYTYAAGEVTITAPGIHWYEVTYSVTAKSATGLRTSGRHELEINGVAVPGSKSRTYHRNTANGEDTGTANVLVQMEAGDVVRIRSTGTENITTVENGCRLRIDSKN